MGDSWSDLPQSVRDRYRAFVFERAGWKCQIEEPHDCSGRAEELDHIVPREVDPSRVEDVSNMRAACLNGNRSRPRPTGEWEPGTPCPLGPHDKPEVGYENRCEVCGRGFISKEW